MTTADREWEVREPRVERYLALNTALKPLGFGSGGGLTALVVDSPRAEYQFNYYEPQYPLGGLVAKERSVPSALPLRTPTDVVGVTSDGVALYLDASTGLVKASTVSGHRGVVIALDTVARVQSACAPNTAGVAFIESAHVDTLFLRTIDDGILRSIPLATDTSYARPPRWADVRLTGFMGGGCALWAPGWQRVITLKDSLVSARLSLMFADNRARWYDRPLSLISKVTGRPRRIAAIVARDVTTVPGTVAVLSASGDIIDLYAMDGGAYVQSIRLPRKALRIAGAGPRIFAISQTADTVRLASYVLPNGPLARTVASEDAGPSTPTWLRRFREDQP